MKNNHYSKEIASYISEKRERQRNLRYSREDSFSDDLISGKELAQMRASEITNSVLSRTTFLDIVEAVCIKLKNMGVIKDDNDKSM